MRIDSVFFIHGAFGHPEENWFPWLRDALEKDGVRVVTPRFPTPDGQSLDAWLEVFESHKKDVTDRTLFVGHSLGPAFILALLERVDVHIPACFLVAGFIELLGDPAFDDINRTFVDRSIDWRMIRAHCQRFFAYHADNDPYVPLAAGEKLAQQLHVDLRIIPQAGHFNEASGYTTFDRLLADIRFVINLHD